MGSGDRIAGLRRRRLARHLRRPGVPAPHATRTSSEHTARLYRNRHDGTFVDVTERPGSASTAMARESQSATMTVTATSISTSVRWASAGVLPQPGDGTFADMTAQAGLTGSGWGTSCAFADLDGDGDLDLYVCHYLADTIDARATRQSRATPLPGQLGYCPPDAFQAEPDVLYRNNGDGTFTDVSRESNITARLARVWVLQSPTWTTTASSISSWPTTRLRTFCIHNLGGLTVRRRRDPLGGRLQRVGTAPLGHGRRPGRLRRRWPRRPARDQLLRGRRHPLPQRGPGDFQVTTPVARLLAPSRGTLGFGAGFLDADNDGWLDLFVTNGHLNDVRPLGMPFQMPPQLFHNDGHGGFSNRAAEAGPYFQASVAGTECGIRRPRQRWRSGHRGQPSGTAPGGADQSERAPRSFPLPHALPQTRRTAVRGRPNRCRDRGPPPGEIPRRWNQLPEHQRFADTDWARRGRRYRSA